MFATKSFSKLARAPLQNFATYAKQEHENRHMTMLAPAVLSTVVVVGIYNMQSVTSDIWTQTHYVYRYLPKSV